MAVAATDQRVVPNNVGTPIVRLRGLTKEYSEGGVNRAVLSAVNADFREGDFVVLLGKSGSGKSTLLNLIGGIDTATAGEVWMRDTCITTLKEPTLTLFRRDHVGFVFQFFNLIPTLTALENISLSYELHGGKRKEADQAARDLLHRVGLGNRADTFPDKLSGGEQQRVAICRALVHQPELILADEPTGNLDSKTSEEILALFQQLHQEQGITLIVVTHAPDIAARAQRIITLRDGLVV